VASLILDKVTLDGNALQILLVGLIFGLVNALIKPFLKLISAPIIVVTLGLFTVIINAFLLWLVDILSGEVLNIDGFLTYLWASIIISLVSWILSLLMSDDQSLVKNYRPYSFLYRAHLSHRSVDQLLLAMAQAGFQKNAADISLYPLLI
jgi:putative membrane protein